MALHRCPFLGAICCLMLVAGCSSGAAPMAGGLESFPAFSDASRNGRVVSNNGGSLTDPGLSQLVSNNAGSLTGTVLGPAGSLVANAGGTFQVQASDAWLAPASGVKVLAIDEQGRPLSEDGITTDAAGRYVIQSLRPSGSVVFVVASYERAGRTLTLMATAPAPRQPGTLEVAVDPGSALVAKKLQTMLSQAALSPEALRPEALEALEQRVSQAMDARMVLDAVCLAPEGAAAVFDRLVEQDPVLQLALQAVTGDPTAAPAPPQDAMGVHTLAGDGLPGWRDGTALEAAFNYPYGVAVAPSGTTYVSDHKNHRIRAVTPDGTVSTLAGTGTAGFRDGPAQEAQFAYPRGIALDASGALIVVDSGRIRRITPDGIVSTLAGNGLEGFVDGAGATAQFATPRGVAVGADGRIYVADTGNRRIREIAPDGRVSTLAVIGAGPAVAAENPLQGPYGVAVDAAGMVYVADATSNAVQQISPAGQVSRLVGGGGWGLVDGDAATAQFRCPVSVTLDRGGNLYVADFFNHSIRMLSTRGQVSTVAGDGTSGDLNGDGLVARFYGPYGLTVDAGGSLTLADTSNHRIRTIRRP